MFENELKNVSASCQQAYQDAYCVLSIPECCSVSNPVFLSLSCEKLTFSKRWFTLLVFHCVKTCSMRAPVTPIWLLLALLTPLILFGMNLLAMMVLGALAEIIITINFKNNSCNSKQAREIIISFSSFTIKMVKLIWLRIFFLCYTFFVLCYCYWIHDETSAYTSLKLYLIELHWIPEFTVG